MDCHDSANAESKTKLLRDALRFSLRFPYNDAVVGFMPL